MYIKAPCPHTHIRHLRVLGLYIGEIEIWCFFANPMYRLGSYKGVTGVFFRFFEMFFPGHALSRQNKALKD